MGGDGTAKRFEGHVVLASDAEIQSVLALPSTFYAAGWSDEGTHRRQR